MGRLLAAIMAAALVLTGCSGADGEGVSASPTIGDISLITVGASDTLAPSITWPEGLGFPEAQSMVVWQGKGAPLVDGQKLVLDMYIQSLDTGEVIRNTFDGLPRAFLLAPELLGTDLYNILLTARVGTRVLSVAPSENEFADEPAIVIVIDVLADTAVGEELPEKADLPLVKAEPGEEPQVYLTEGQPLPVDLSVSTLILGQGEQIVPGSFILAQYTAIYTADGTKGEKTWAAGDIRQTSWLPEQAPFEGQVGKGKLLRAWDEGLIDQTAGSRVMLVVPEEWGYPGEGTIVYVIDILDVWNPDS